MNLIPKASRALADSAARTGLSKTDTVNRALQLYEFVVSETEQGAKVILSGGSEQGSRIVKLL